MTLPTFSIPKLTIQALKEAREQLADAYLNDQPTQSIRGYIARLEAELKVGNKWQANH